MTKQEEEEEDEVESQHDELAHTSQLSVYSHV